MMRLIARLVPPVLVMALVVALWYVVGRLALDRAVAALAAVAP
jgi:uncharacterized membrane protein